MSRTSNSYGSVIRGVSEQVPHDRIEGQHWEQDNLISDPVRGLARRHGSQQQHAVPLTAPISSWDTADAADRQEQTVFVGNVEYGILHRESTKPNSQLHPLIVINKDTRKLVPVTATPTALSILGDGVSSITAAGQYVLLASATRPVAHSVTDNTLASGMQHVVWIRGGVAARTFTVYARIDGVERKYEYKTMSSYYEGVLDTSDIPLEDPPGTPNKNYSKLVNDRVNAYNTAVNQHLGAVSKDIAPANIAAKLAELMRVHLPTARSDGPYILLEHGGTVLTADDGGNGDLMRAVSESITAAELVSPRHFPGKVIKVVPKAANSLAYYLKAESTSGGTAFGEVTWRETAGSLVKLSWVFCIGVFNEGRLYVAESPGALSALTGGTVPEISESSSGDTESAPPPEFFGKVITYMRMFQDRLMIVAGSTVFLSKSGDYFNFFRKSVLTVADDDPIEVFAQGTEDDIITGGVQHDRNVILCGKRFQYIVPGRESMTPRNPYVGVQASYEGANLVQHAVAGTLLFFCQRRERRLTLQRMQPGAVADRLDALDISNQLDGYLTGTPRQIVAMTAPGVVFVRTRELTNGFYVYSYLDSNEERLFDSWSRWVFDKSLGTLAGITADDSGLLAVTMRETKTGAALVLDRFVRETATSDYPYLDSQVPADANNHIGAEACAVFAQPSVRALLGDVANRASELITRYPSEAQHLRVGTLYDSFVVLTSPYIRDREDKIILDARVTVTKLVASVSNTGAMIGEVSTDMGATWRVARRWRSRIAGLWKLNSQSVEEETSVTIPVLKENKKYRARIRSLSWQPFTLAIVEWSGQAFTSRR